MSRTGALTDEVAAIRRRLDDLVPSPGAKPLPTARRRALDSELRSLVADLEAALARLDPVALPTAIFDPSEPKIIGRFAALALVAQSPVPLAEKRAFYGSGVYALYYRGAFPLYAPLSGSETPIYVGKAGPALHGARTAREQGQRLAARLNDHRKNIGKASSTLNVADFAARFLVIQSGWETAAENHLIHLFRPLWNNEVDVLYGLGKHGNSHETRANKRSPWDSLHPGRKWAAGTKEDARSIARFEVDVRAHFAAQPVYRDTAQLLEAFFADLRQAQAASVPSP